MAREAIYDTLQPHAMFAQLSAVNLGYPLYVYNSFYASILVAYNVGLHNINGIDMLPILTRIYWREYENSTNEQQVL